MNPPKLAIAIILGVLVATVIFYFRQAVKPRGIEAEVATLSLTNLNLGGNVADFLPPITELARRASLAGLSMGINRGNEGYEALSNEIWAIYTIKPTSKTETHAPHSSSSSKP